MFSKNLHTLFLGRTSGLSACSRLASAGKNISLQGVPLIVPFLQSVFCTASDIGELPLQSLAHSAQKPHKSKKYILIFSFLLLFISQNMVAQIQPVTASFSLIPPFSPFLCDFYETGSNKINATLIFNDYNEASWDVKLHLKIEGDNGILLETKSDFMPLNPITLTPGVPKQISGSDFTDYFNYDNMNISGIAPFQLAQNGILPEGYYTFTFWVEDFQSGKKLSHEHTSYAMIQLGGIPQALQPNANFVMPANPQNILFQWNLSSPALNPANTEYRLLIYEITGNVEPQTAIQSGNAIQVFVSDWQMSNSFVYNASCTLLETGKKYAYQIQVHDRDRERMFRNNGMSDVYWFTYGYPTGGKVELSKPENDYVFKKSDKQYFQWKAPDNKVSPTQNISYYLKIVPLQTKDDDLETAIANNPVFYENTSQETTNPQGWGLTVDEPIERDKWYAWQVHAFSGEQEIAKSPIYRFRGAPLIDKMRAGYHDIQIISLENSDLNDLKGIGRVFLDTAKEKFVDIPFEHLKVQNRNDFFVLLDGSLQKDTNALPDIKIKPIDKTGEDILVHTKGVKIDKNALQIKVDIEIPIDLPIDKPDRKIKSESRWVNYDKFKILGSVPIPLKVDILDPINFSLELDTLSRAVISQKGYQMYYFGRIALPQNVKDLEGNRIYIPFINKKQLYYFSVDIINDDIELQAYRPLANTGLIIQPQHVVVDFSEDKSPAGMASDWKGVYVSNYQKVFKQKFDKIKQIQFAQDYKYDVDISRNSFRDKNSITSGGLQFFCDQQFTNDEKITFNTFPANIDLFKIEMENSTLKEGKINGSILIPVLDQETPFNFRVQATDEGFRDGYINPEEFANRFVQFSTNSEDAQINFTVKRAVFKEHQYLSMDVDIDIPALKIKVPGVQDFRAYGDYQIGFGDKNKAVNFDNRLTGIYKGVYKIIVDKIGAAFNVGKYVAYYSGTIQLSNDISGKGGEPIHLNMYSSMDVSDEFGVEIAYESQPDIKIPTSVASIPPEEMPLTPDSFYIHIQSGVANMDGYVTMKRNDPVWGTCFRGVLDGEVYAPAKIKVGAEIIVGNTRDEETNKKIKYWKFDAYFNDTQGTGIPIVPGVVNLTALEGKVFHHMKAEKDEEGNFSIKPNANQLYGAGLYMNLIDGEGAHIFKSDLGVEINAYKGSFELAADGQITILNLKGRGVGGAAAENVGGEPLESVEKQVASQVVEQINGKTVDFGDVKLTPHINEDLQGGGLKAVFGDYTMDLGAQMGETKGASFYFQKKNDFEISLKGDNSPTGDFLFHKFNSPSILVNAGYAPEAQGIYMGFDYDNKLGLGGSFNKKKKAGSFYLTYDKFHIAGGANKAEKFGYAEFSMNNIVTNVYGDIKNRAGKVEFQYDNNYAMLQIGSPRTDIMDVALQNSKKEAKNVQDNLDNNKGEQGQNQGQNQNQEQNNSSTNPNKPKKNLLQQLDYSQVGFALRHGQDSIFMHFNRDSKRPSASFAFNKSNFGFSTHLQSDTAHILLKTPDFKFKAGFDKNSAYNTSVYEQRQAYNEKNVDTTKQAAVNNNNLTLGLLAAATSETQVPVDSLKNATNKQNKKKTFSPDSASLPATKLTGLIDLQLKGNIHYGIDLSIPDKQSLMGGQYPTGNIYITRGSSAFHFVLIDQNNRGLYVNPNENERFGALCNLENQTSTFDYELQNGKINSGFTSDGAIFSYHYKDMPEKQLRAFVNFNNQQGLLKYFISENNQFFLRSSDELTKAIINQDGNWAYFITAQDKIQYQIKTSQGKMYAVSMPQEQKTLFTQSFDNEKHSDVVKAGGIYKFAVNTKDFDFLWSNDTVRFVPKPTSAGYLFINQNGKKIKLFRDTTFLVNKGITYLLTGITQEHTPPAEGKTAFIFNGKKHLYSDDKIVFKEQNNSYTVSANGFALNYDKYSVKYENGKAEYKQQDFIYSAENKVYKLTTDNNQLLSYSNGEIAYSDNNQINLKINSQSGVFAQGKHRMEFAGTKVAYTNGTQNYEFSDNLDIEDNGVHFGILNTSDPVQLTYFMGYKQYELAYSYADGIKTTFGDNHIAVMGHTESDEPKYIDAKLLDNRLVLAKDQFQYTYKGTGLSYGGDDDMMAFLHKDEKIAITKDWGIAFDQADKGVKIKSTGEISLRNGGQEIVVGGASPVKIIDKDNGIDGSNAQGTDGFNFKVAGMEFKVQATKGNNAAISTKIPGVNVGVEIESHGKEQMQIAFNKGDKSISLYKNVYTWGFGSYDEGPSINPDIEMSGPEHIGYITHNSTSILQGRVHLDYSSKTKTMHLQGAVGGMKPFICFKNAKFDAKFSPEKWYIKLGEAKKREDWFQVKPLCLFTVDGYMYIASDEIALGLGTEAHFSLNASKKINLGLYKPTIGFKVKFGYDLYGIADIGLDPFAFKQIEIDAKAYGDLKACMGGCTTLVSTKLHGNLIMAINNPETYVKGKLNASVKVFGYGVTVGFKAKVKL